MSDAKKEISKKIAQLEEKYAVTGQDMAGYLDGLLHSKPLTYWDYIHLDALLSLQTPRTDLPDEMVFISYHQMCELMFQLILRECKALCDNDSDDEPVWEKHLTRLIRYWRHLVSSFDIMTQGLEKEQFINFRMALLPSSGFQSVQYRQIEIYSTSLNHLIHVQSREQYLSETNLNVLYQQLYWKSSNIELKTGKKTLTLAEFEKKYDKKLLALAEELQYKNMYFKFYNAPKAVKTSEKVLKLLKTYDQTVNLYWPLAHLGAAKKFLHKDPEDLIATGGTNWQDYLPPQHQKIVFFPDVWQRHEKDNWGQKQ